MAFIEAKNLSFQYPMAGKKSLDTLNFSIEKGEFVVLFGETGCGKSTLLRQMKPSVLAGGKKSGKLFFQQKEFNCLSKREEAVKIGFVFQNPDNQIVTDKVWHELAFTLENLGTEERIIQARIAEIAAFFGITDWFSKSVHELSGGQKQILNLASVMIAQPELLLLDEPASQLDPITAQKFLELLSQINEEFQTTIIMSEHRLDDVYKRADRCMIMENGKLLFFDIPEEVTRFLANGKKRYFDFLPAQVKLPVKLRGDYSCKTIRQAKNSILKEKIESERKITHEISEEKQEILYQIKNIWYRYGKEDKDILCDFSLTVRRGDFFAVLGANGQGKSTLLSLLCNLIFPYRGKLIYKGKKLIKNQMPEEVCMLPQNPQSLFLKKTVLEDLQVVSYETNEVTELLGLNDVLQRHPYDLSGGQQQMVALAKLLLKKPKVLLLDEPTKGIDKNRREQLGQILKLLNEQGTTIIIASHDIDFCGEYAKTAGILFQGSLLCLNGIQEFCMDQYFYTTCVRKIMRGIMDDIVTERQVQQLEFEKK